MKTILVVNGEKYWQDFLPEYKVVQKRIQNTSWVLKNGDLYVIDEDGAVKPDGIIWRVGAIKANGIQQTALNLIEFSGIPCINSIETLKHGFDRLSMLTTLKRCGLPIIHFNVATKSTQLKNIKIPFPFVVKTGSYHAGYGKVLVENEEKWQDIMDLLFITEEYTTVEPFINYKKNIRCIAIADKVWAMSRKGKLWKTNAESKAFKIISPQSELVNQIQTLQTYLKADIVAIEILEEDDGTQHIVKYNDIPSLSGLPDDLKYEFAYLIKRKFSENLTTV